MNAVLEMVKGLESAAAFPENELFEKHWSDVLAKAPEAKSYRDIARIWFQWGYSDAKFNRVLEDLT